jgi:hypothetical protein
MFVIYKDHDTLSNYPSHYRIKFLAHAFQLWHENMHLIADPNTSIWYST